MSKKLLLALALAGLSSAAMAQVPAAATASAPAGVAAAPLAVTTGGVAPTLAAAPKAGLVPATAVADGQADSLVNPFNGKPLSAEQLQRELEISRMRTQGLEEQLKQTNTLAEIRNVPIRKAVEAAQAMTQAKKEEVNIHKLEQELKPPAPPPAPAAPVKSAKELAREKAEKLAAEKRAAKAAAELAAKTPPATLLSVVQLGGKRSVVLDIKGNIATVSDGATSPVGPVRVLNDHSAEVNGWTLKVHEQTLGRFVESDPSTTGAVAAVSPNNPMAVKPATSLPPPIPAANGMPPAIPAGTQGPGNFTQLPPSGNFPSPLPNAAR
ncbi:hypothetical protein D3C71_22980 [compost metagenome]